MNGNGMDMATEQISKNDKLTQSVIGDEYVTPECLAKDLGRSVRTLDRWDLLRIGPPRTRVGRMILYRREAVLEWLRSRETRTPQRDAKRRRRTA